MNGSDGGGLCPACFPAPGEVARLAENAQAGRAEAFVGTGHPETVLACAHGSWRLGDVLDAADEAAGDGPVFEDHPDLRCPECGKPVVRLASTAAGVPGRWRKGCAEHSTGRKETPGAVQAGGEAGSQDSHAGPVGAAPQGG